MARDNLSVPEPTSDQRPSEPDRFGAARDTRQLFALDRRSGRIVYLHEGAADAFRADCAAGHLICPLPRCADPRYLAVGGLIRRHHFRHRTAGLPPHDERAWNHQTAKLLLGQHLRDRHPDLSIAVNEDTQDASDSPDILVRTPAGGVLAIEVQYARLTVERWRERHDAYAAEKTRDVWIFGHLPPHFRRPRHGQEAEEAVQLGSLLRAVSWAHMPVYFIDPDRRELATALIESGSLYGQLAEFAIDPLDTVQIEDGELMTPGTRRELAAIAERQRREREEQERFARETQRRRPRSVVDAARTSEAPVPPAPDPGADESVRARQTAAEEWQQAIPEFLAQVGLDRVPEIVSYEQPGDYVIALAPAHWHARLIYRWIEGRIGESFSFRDAAALFAEDDPENAHRIYEAVSLYLLHLRRSGYVHFETSGRDIYGPITVLADLKHPPSERLAHFAPGGPFRVRLVKNAGRLVVVSEEGELVADLRPLREGE